jgi:hypothetical protein
MSKKRTKQYLMLLMVVGLVSIAAGGGGTFASFSAETTNTGNTFATGSLFLHNTANGGNTCTSESASTNLNDGTSGTTCTTLFNVSLTSANTAQYATLALQNAGTVDAGDIKFALKNACANAAFYEDRSVTLTANYTHGTTTLHLSSLPVALRAGEHLELKHGATTDVVAVATAAAPNAGATTVTLSAGTASNDYVSGDSVLFTADFGSGNICSALKFTIAETTDGSFAHTPGDNATCAYPAAADAGDGSGCNFADASVGTLSALTTTQTALTLASAGGSSNTGTNLSAGGTRYFVIGVKPDTTAFDNNFQDRQASFDMVWHIDQA